MIENQGLIAFLFGGNITKSTNHIRAMACQEDCGSQIFLYRNNDSGIFHNPFWMQVYFWFIYNKKCV